MKYFNMSLVALFIAAGFMQTAAASLGSDRTNYPGSNCVRYAGSTSITYNSSEIRNNSITTNLYLDCIADKNDTGGYIDSHWVRMRDRNGAANRDVSCRAYSAFGKTNASGMWSWFGPLLKTVGSSPYVQHKSTGTNVSSNSAAHYYLSCVIPPYNAATGGASGIVTYQINEH